MMIFYSLISGLENNDNDRVVSVLMDTTHRYQKEL